MDGADALPEKVGAQRRHAAQLSARSNAPMESVNGTLKVECVNDEHFKTREQARQAIVEYIGYYNTERRHSSLGNIAPAEFERRWRAGTTVNDTREAPAWQRVTHRRPVPGSSQATEPAVRG